MAQCTVISKHLTDTSRFLRHYDQIEPTSKLNGDGHSGRPDFVSWTAVDWSRELTKYQLHKVHFTGPWNLTYWSILKIEFITVKMLWNCWKFKKDNSLKNHSLNLQFRFVRHIHEGWKFWKDDEFWKTRFSKKKSNLWYLILYKMHMTLTQTRKFLKIFEHNNWMFNDLSKVTLVFSFDKNYFGFSKVENARRRCISL